MHRTRPRAGVRRQITCLEQLDKIMASIGLLDQIATGSRRRRRPARADTTGPVFVNVKDGRCEVCRGNGQIKIEMHFLPDVYGPCEHCHGERYYRETLELRLKGNTIANALETPIEKALEFFTHPPHDPIAGWRR